MAAYKHEEYGSGTSHGLGFYAAVAAITAAFGTVMAVLTWS